MKLLNILLIILVIGVASIFAQTAALTYQGRLTDDSSSANGSYQMRFSLFDTNSGGTQVGSTIEITNVSVANGVFTVELNFGSPPFPSGQDRYLQVEVRRNAGEVYTPLTPRQQITATPYAIRSLVANTADNSIQLGGIAFNQYVQTTDPRLSDARTPSAGSNDYIQNSLAPQAGANFNVGGTGTADSFNSLSSYKINGAVILRVFDIGNLFIGKNAGSGGFVTGNENTFVGSTAGRNISSGDGNTFIGGRGGVDNTTGSYNTFLGTLTGFVNTTGSSNTFMGYAAGLTNTSGSNNTLFGYYADVSSGNLAFATSIGAQAVVSTSNTIQLGRSADRTNVSGVFNVLNGRATPVERGDVNFTTNSGNLDLYLQGSGNGNGINFGVSSPPTGNATLFISQFDGTTYQDRVRINPTGAVEIRQLGSAGSTALCRNSLFEISACSSSIRYKSNVENFSNGISIIKKLRPVSFNWTEGGMLDFGLVAEEVFEVEPLLTTQNTEGKTEGVKYDRIGVVLVNAVNEQQIQIEEQKTANQKLQTQIEKQQQQISELKQIVCPLKPDAKVCQEENQ